LAAITARQSLELWAIPPTATGFLGVIPAGGKGKVIAGDAQKALIGKPIAGSQPGTEGRFADRATDRAGVVSRGIGGVVIALWRGAVNTAQITRHYQFCW
jgi:hypothetical protein